MDSWLRCLGAVLLVSVTVSACSQPTSASIAQSSLPRDANPGVEQPIFSGFVEANNTFAIDLFHSLIPQRGNLVFSPYSISAALAMTYAGARGDTESEMARALHFELGQASLHPAFNQLDLALVRTAKSSSADEHPLQLRIANALWIEKTLPVLKSYLDIIARNYGAGVRLTDFVNQYEPARLQINDWVSDQTQKKIKDLIPQGVLDSYTRMVLVNAIYFKGDWLQQFDPADTKSAAFHRLDGSDIQAQLMFDQISAPYATGNGYSAIELAYQGGTAAMDIIVPDDGRFDSFESGLTAKQLDELLGGMQPASVALGLPKFQFASKVDLGDALSALGMPDAFNPDIADFSGMTGGRDLFISKVLHQSFVAVDEKGTEAAAATSIIMAPTSAMEPGVILTVDRPFIFVIRDLSTRQILFIGHVLDPKAG